MEQLTILVKGSVPEPYELTFIKDGASLTALCTCPAGTFGNLCKHRITILDGDGSAAVGDDIDKVARVVEWLAGSDVETALSELRDVSSDSGASRDALSAAKRKLARAMNS